MCTECYIENSVLFFIKVLDKIIEGIQGQIPIQNI